MGAMCNNEEMFSIQKSHPIFVRPETKSIDGFYFLCNLDQNILGLIKTVYCFKADEKKNSESIANVIKQALAKVLDHFYPLAGNLTVSPEGKVIVNCSNQGVPFVEAVAECDIDVLGDISMPKPEILGQLVHTTPEAKDVFETPLLTVQVTRFKCGGFVLGMTINHCMTDGISAMEFVNSWAETARGISLTIPPAIDRTILRSRQPPNIQYPHKEYMEIQDNSNIATLFQQEQVIAKKFEFDLEKLGRLKKIAMEDGSIKSCTSFTVLSALVWRARSKALKMKPDQQTKLLLAVNGRSMLNPPLPKGYFGNGIVLTCCVCSAGELTEKPLSFAVGQVQNAIKMVTGEYIRSSIDHFEVNRTRSSLIATLCVTAWNRLDFNSTDFGWGEPTKSGAVTLPDKEVALLLSGQKKGTNLLIGLPTSAMNTFEDLMHV